MPDSLTECSRELPLVTIAMPIYNAGQYLRMAVLSMVQQTYQHWELLLIDDGSTDNALKSIKDLTDPRIRIFQDGINKGLAVRLNECIDMAEGKYIARMDQDDVSFPERLARQVAMLEESPLLDLIATRAITINEAGDITGEFPCALSHQDICARPWQGFYLPHPTWMGSATWFRRYLYSVPGPYFCEDQELLLRSFRDSQFGTVDEVLFAYRIRSAVNQKKLAKTRHTVLECQLRAFIADRQWLFLVLSIVVYVARVFKDSATQLIKPSAKHGYKNNMVLLKWNKTLQEVSSLEKTDDVDSF
ncbi:MAG: glycosyltransferase family 2 protein [Sideroxydans sp.]|nr:glycosyltransferase family 2 protein [Sideroxydans sp.]